jgi:uncharacterized protein (DUF1697 family)
MMTRYASMLRAVNVSGQRKLKMTELRELCESLGHSDVETYLQSGNILLTTRMAQTKLGPSLSDAIAREFGYSDVDVLVWTAGELASLIQTNPFLARGCDPAKLHVTFLARDPGAVAIESIGTDRYIPDEFAAGKKAVYVYCPNGYGRTKLNNAFFERKLDVPATTRNWQTVSNLYALTRGQKLT